MSTGSFGQGRPEPTSSSEQMPVPVLHVGEVHADLRLHLSDDTKQDLGSQIASVIATAVMQGIEYGVAEAMQRVAGDEPAPEFAAGQADVPTAGRLTENDLRRARGE